MYQERNCSGVKIEHYTKTEITGLWFGLCTSLALYPWVNHFLSVFPSVMEGGEHCVVEKCWPRNLQIRFLILELFLANLLCELGKIISSFTRPYSPICKTRRLN